MVGEGSPLTARGDASRLIPLASLGDGVRNSTTLDTASGDRCLFPVATNAVMLSRTALAFGRGSSCANVGAATKAAARGTASVMSMSWCTGSSIVGGFSVTAGLRIPSRMPVRVRPS